MKCTRVVSHLVILFAAAALALPGQTLTKLVDFDFYNNGDSVYSTLVQGFDGTLYGTTSQGWPCNQGTIFKMTPGGALTTLYLFPAQLDCSGGVEGGNPYAGLIQGTDGNLYGTATTGGDDSCPAFNGYGGCGTVFKITTARTLTTLHRFNGTDGANPYAGLIQASDGNFYGTTYLGGANGYGTVFKIAPAGTLTTLHSFTSTDGAYPGALTQSTSGYFYGITYGSTGIRSTIFRISPNGTMITLHRFSQHVSSYPAASKLLQGTDGNFYGTTYYGGTSGCKTGVYPGCGTIFEITPAGVFTTLYSFNKTDGANPAAGLVQGTDGNLYGTTAGGGTSGGYGTIFMFTPGGVVTSLYSFNKTDGFSPNALVQDTNGSFYGTTLYGGINNYGTMFSYTAGLGPFITTLPSSGRVGVAVKILGTNLKGATSVSFNGVPATITAVRSTIITTTVPTGATTGPVQVVTPTGTLSSNVVFRVR